MCIWYSTSVQAGGRAQRVFVSLCCDVIEQYDFQTCMQACVSVSCTRIMHAWCASVPEVPQGPGKEAGGALWRRGSRPLVRAVTSVEGFLQQGAKREDSRGEQALFSLGWCVSVCVCVVEIAVLQPCLLLPTPPSFLVCLVFSTDNLQLSNQTKVNLSSQA